jgi:DNA repair exonuclease SbcCD nuclease subunit
MSLLLFTDLHLHDFSQFRVPDTEFGSSRVRSQILSLKWIAEVVEERKPDIVVFGGDFVEDRRRIDWSVYNRGYNEIKRIASIVRSYGGEFFLLRGNHDAYGMAEHQSAVFPVSGISGIRVVSNPQRLAGIKFIPYLKGDPPSDGEEDVELAIAHLSVIELRINGGSYAGGCPIDALGAKRVLAGHYHVASTWHSASGRRLDYVGAILPRNFSDEGLGHFGATFLDWNGSGSVGRLEQLGNPHAWRFHRIEDPDLAEGALERLLEGLRSQLYLHIHVVPERRREVEKRVRGTLDPARARWVVLDSRTVRRADRAIEAESKLEDTRSVGASLSDEAVLESYVRRHGSSSEQQSLIELGRELLNGTFSIPR